MCKNDPEPATLTQTLAQWGSTLRFMDIPQRIREYAVSQLISNIATIRASLDHPLGTKILATFASTPMDSKSLACALASLSTSLYYEDTMFTGHVSHASVNVPLSYVDREHLDGPQLLTSVVAASECSARIASAATLGPFRGQSASYVQLVGSVAGRLRAESAPANRWVDAWGLALAAPPWTLMRAFMGSDAKILSSAAPVRTGLDACDAARAGICGAADILEHPHGLLATFAEVPLPEFVVVGLGTRWHTDTLTFKVHPVGAYLDAAIECAIKLHRYISTEDIAQIVEVVARVPRFTIEMDRMSEPYRSAGVSPAVVLNMSVAYNVATALLTGSVGPQDLAPPNSTDPRRWELASKVRCVHDRSLGHRLLLSTAPLGEALRGAGHRARAWLHDFAGLSIDELLPGGTMPSQTFTDAHKMAGAGLQVRFADGRVKDLAVDAPIGAAGSHTRREHAAIVRDKALATGLSSADVEALRRVPELGHLELREVLDHTLFGCL